MNRRSLVHHQKQRRRPQKRTSRVPYRRAAASLSTPYLTTLRDGHSRRSRGEAMAGLGSTDMVRGVIPQRVKENTGRMMFRRQ